MLAPIGFKDFIHAAHIKRWHIIKTNGQQTLAEHHWLVTVIALELYKRLGVEAQGGWHQMDVAMLALAAMFHDATEMRTGDIPTPGKKLLRAAAGDPALFDSIDGQLMPEIPYLRGTLPTEFARIVKLADEIEGFCFIRENGVGRYTEKIADKAQARIAKLVDDAKQEQSGWGWDCVFPLITEILESDLDQ